MSAGSHISIAGIRSKLVTTPDPRLLDDVVAPKVLDAYRRASDALQRAGVRHVLIGGLAVGANGYPRNTKDVDFLVGPEAFEHHPGGLVTLRAGVPFQVNGVAIDFLSPDAEEGFLRTCLDAPAGSIIPAGPLVYLKLKASRLRDQTDIVELVKTSLDITDVRSYLATNAPAMVAQFETLVARAQIE